MPRKSTNFRVLATIRKTKCTQILRIVNTLYQSEFIIVLDVQIGHHFAKVRQSVVIRIRVDVREILAGVGLDEARIISAQRQRARQ